MPLDPAEGTAPDSHARHVAPPQTEVLGPLVVGYLTRLFGPLRRPLDALQCVTVVQGHPRSLLSFPVPVEKAYRPLLINGNYCSILHRFGDTATSKPKMANFPTFSVMKRYSGV